MSETVIQADGLWKKYRLGVLGTGTLRHDFNRWLHRVRGKPDPYARVDERQTAEFKSPLDQPPASGLADDEMWALRGVSFEVKQGEILGIIGRNGAGKSTLLKILSRVTAPTSGEVRVKGRIASLLEVGTGFHPELTGRENIFLNGAILGMTKAEIKKKFDEIVEFSGVERYVDTPVKRYSSGMYVRLAFAVAAHLESEILIVDEVLAVGDGQFQKKCMGKMQDVATNGRTILFVSHNMLAIRQLCSDALLLENGQVGSRVHPAQVSEDYHANARTALVKRNGHQPGNAHIVDFQLQGRDGRPVGNIQAGEKATLSIQIETNRRNRLSFGMTVFNSDDIGIFSTVTSDSFVFIPPDTSVLSIEIPTGLLNAGRYRVEGSLMDDVKIVDSNECYLQFEIHRGGSFELAQNKPKGILRFPGTWTSLKNEC